MCILEGKSENGVDRDNFTTIGFDLLKRFKYGRFKLAILRICIL